MKGIGIIDKFNESVRIEEVYERVTGKKVGKKSNCNCPFHASNNNGNAGIDSKNNSFSCFSHKCVTAMKPYEFIAKYHGLENEKFPVIAQKINEYYPNSFKIYSRDIKEKKDCILSNFYTKIDKELKNKIKIRIDLLNDFVLNKYGIETNILKMKQLWEYVKVNEFYSSVSDYIEIDENVGSFKIDEERLIIEITNRVLKFRNKCIKTNKVMKNIIETGKKISNEYKINPSNELKEKLEKYRLEYTLLNRDHIDVKNNTLSIKEKLLFSNRAGLEYIGNENIDIILKNNTLYDLNKKLCEIISEQEKDAFICGNIDYTVSIINLRPFNNNNKLIEEKHIKYIDNELESLREAIGSSCKDRYFYNEELIINKKINSFLVKSGI